MARIIPIDRLTLKLMIRHNAEYGGLSEGLSLLPVPLTIRIGRKNYAIPQTVDEFTAGICYGQRMFFAHDEPNDYGAIIRTIDGYYFPVVTGEKWDQDRALLFGKIVITCKVLELYPVVIHLIKLIGEMIAQEQRLLHREPTKMELAAGVEKLNIFSDLTALNFLRDAMKIPVAEVLLTPYRECLVRFMLEKETEDYKTRYIQLMNEEYKSKNKKPSKPKS